MLGGFGEVVMARLKLPNAIPELQLGTTLFGLECHAQWPEQNSPQVPGLRNRQDSREQASV